MVHRNAILDHRNINIHVDGKCVENCDVAEITFSVEE